MKIRLRLVILTIVLLALPACGLASTVYEGTGWIFGPDGVVVDFSTDTAPYTYVATLTDLSVDPYCGFEFLFFSISSVTGTIDYRVVDLGVGQGSLTFDVAPWQGQTLFANIAGIGGGQLGAGNYGLQINAVPIPSALILLGSGIFGLLTLRRSRMH